MNPTANQVFSVYFLSSRRRTKKQKIVKIICTRKSVNLCITESQTEICYEFHVVSLLTNYCCTKTTSSVIPFEIVDTINEWKLHKELVTTQLYTDVPPCFAEILRLKRSCCTKITKQQRNYKTH